MAHGDMVTRGHLGGYVEGGDPATFYPGLWSWLIETLGVKRVIDVGCGEGHALRWFRKHGCLVLGIDGIEQEDWNIIAHDYTYDAWPRQGEYGHNTQPEYDLAWSCEFVEHVEERYVPNFLATFACAKLVLMTHGEPGQGGYHHVNNQTADYWRGAMAAIGYEFDPDLTQQARELSSTNTDPYNHFRRSGLAFRRR